MTWPRIFELPYQEDGLSYFSCIKDRSWPVWLDSGRPMLSQARYDIMTADPVDTIQLNAEAAEGLPERLRTLLQVKGKGNCPEHIPFCGGLIGYMSYELGRVWQGFPALSVNRLAPDVCAGLYDWALIIDHKRQTALLASAGNFQATRESWSELCQLFSKTGEKTSIEDSRNGVLSEHSDHESYAQGFASIQQYIREGDIYQVNFTRRFQAELKSTPLALYQKLRTVSPAPYGAFLGFPEFQVLSNSPEQFVGLVQDQVQTRPIKGTRPRGDSVQHDTRLRVELAASDKERAENLMIVDLLRNDLGKVCVPGSIKVPELFAIESYATVHHLVSTVCGKLSPENDVIDLLKACFPGGSITGAPKFRAMQIIDELEPVSRELYCGSIFRIGFDGNMDSSISIRTLLKREDDLYYWAGGGIVADSNLEAEYQESLDKTAAFFKLLSL